MSSDDENEESKGAIENHVDEKVPTQQEDTVQRFTEQEGRVWKLEAPIEAGSIFSRGKKNKGKKKEEDGWTSIVWLHRPIRLCFLKEWRHRVEFRGYWE